MANPALLPTCRINSTGNKGDDSEGHDSRRSNDAQEIKETAPDHGDVRIESVRVDNRGYGVGSVVKSVYKFESQRDEQREA